MVGAPGIKAVAHVTSVAGVELARFAKGPELSVSRPRAARFVVPVACAMSVKARPLASPVTVVGPCRSESDHPGAS